MAATFLSIFMFAGLGVAACGLFAVWKANETASWTPVEGRIIQSEVVRKSGVKSPTYAPEVHYMYEADGALRTGTRIFVGDGIATSDRRYAERYCDRYSVGAVVEVYHDPFDPVSAVLEPGVSRKTFIPLAFGLGFALFGGWLSLMFWLFEG